MGWNPIRTAPKDGRAICVRVRDYDNAPLRVLPWMVFFSAGRWRYRTTGVPLHDWHRPVEWDLFEPVSELCSILTLPSGALLVTSRDFCEAAQ